MKKQDLLKVLDDDLLNKVFRFCYTRTNDSWEAGALCSDIIYALVKAAHTEGEITNLYSFVWRVARNVYADYSADKRKHADTFYDGDADEVLRYVADPEQTDESGQLLKAVYRRIVFLTRAYREVMIMYYIDGLSTREIAKRQCTSEGAVRQRLFSARQKIKSEVKEMKETTEFYNKPLALEQMDYVIWGTGDPSWGDPRRACTRMFSNHVVYLCYKKPMSASEIAEELNVPTVYVEEELEILTRGENRKYGLLRRLESGKYAINFILFDKDIIGKAHALYQEQPPAVSGIIADYVEEQKDKFLSFPYLNKKVDLNLVLWQQISSMTQAFSDHVERILAEKHFSQAEEVKRPFSVFGYVDNGKHYGGGWDGVYAQNVCGFSEVQLENIYITRIKPHFHCGLNIAAHPQLQLALRAIEGLDVNTLSELEKEHAAKAIECGYLYREGEMLYTKILVSAIQDHDRLFDISRALSQGYFEKEAQAVAEKLSALIKKAVPAYLLGEWRLANRLASMPVVDFVVEFLIEKGFLIPPESGIGAEGCWMSVKKS